MRSGHSGENEKGVCGALCTRGEKRALASADEREEQKQQTIRFNFPWTRPRALLKYTLGDAGD